MWDFSIHLPLGEGRVIVNNKVAPNNLPTVHQGPSKAQSQQHQMTHEGGKPQAGVGVWGVGTQVQVQATGFQKGLFPPQGGDARCK